MSFVAKSSNGRGGGAEIDVAIVRLNRANGLYHFDLRPEIGLMTLHSVTAAVDPGNDGRTKSAGGLA